MSYLPTLHDLGVERIGAELGRLSVSDKLSALFCRTSDEDLNAIANYIFEYLHSNQGEDRQPIIDWLTASAAQNY